MPRRSPDIFSAREDGPVLTQHLSEWQFILLH